MKSVQLKITPSPLKVEHYFFPVLEYKAFPAENPDDIPETKLSKIATSANPVSDDNKTWYVSIDLFSEQSEEKPLLFEYHLMAVGIFKWDAEIRNLDFVSKAISVSGASILYGALREELRTMSSKGPWGIYNLPTVRFDPVVNDPEDTSDEE